MNKTSGMENLMAKREADLMRKHLKLNTEQLQKIEEATVKHVKAAESHRKEERLLKEDLKIKKEALRKAKKDELKSILTSEQYKKLSKLDKKIRSDQKEIRKMHASSTIAKTK